MDFRWNEWNVAHLGRHGVEPDAAEYVVETARRSYPRRIGDDKMLVWGPGPSGELLQVVFVFDADGSVYVIHARRLTDAEIRRYRRRAR